MTCPLIINFKAKKDHILNMSITDKIHPKIWKKGRGDIDDIILYALNQVSPMMRTEFLKIMNKNTFHIHAKHLKSNGYIDSYREGKNSYYIITPSGENHLFRKLVDIKLDFETLLSIERKKSESLIQKVSNFFIDNAIDDKQIQLEFIKLALVITQEKLKEIYSEEDKFNKLLLFLVLNHPKFYPEYSISINTFMAKYNTISAGTLSLHEIGLFIEKIVDEKIYNINFHKLELGLEQLNLFFTENSEYGEIFKITVDHQLKDLVLLKKLKNSELNYEDLETIYTNISSRLIDDYGIFHPDLKNSLLTLIDNYRKTTREHLIKKTTYLKSEYKDYLSTLKVPLLSTMKSFLSEVDGETFENLRAQGKYEELIQSIDSSIAKKDISKEELISLYRYKCDLLCTELRDFDEALNTANHMVRLYPMDKDPLNVLGFAYMYRKEYDKAIDSYNKALEIDPHYEVALRNLTYTYIQTHQYNEALEIADRLNEPEKIKWRGIVYQKEKDYNTAIENFKLYLKKDPGNTSVRRSLIISYFMDYDYDNALKICNKALKLEPNNAEFWYLQGVIYARKLDYDQSISALKRAIELEPDNLFYWVDLGNVYESNEMIEEAIKIYKQLIEKESTTGEFWYSLGVVYKKIGDNDESSSALQKAIELLKNELGTEQLDFDKWNTLGVAYRENGEFENSIDTHKRAIQINPNDGSSYRYLALTYDKMELKDKAIEYYESAIKLDSKNPDNYHDIIKVYEESDDLRNLLLYRIELSKLIPNDINNLVELSRLYNLNGDIKESISYLEKAKDTAPQNDLIWHQLGYILAANSIYDDAIKAFNKAIELNKKSYDSFSNLAYIYIMKEDFQKTIELAEKSITIQMAIKKEKPKLNINTDLAKPYAHLGYALYNTGEREKAIKHIEKSINLDSNYHRAPLYLAKIYYDLKNFKEALKHINESLTINENFSEGIELQKKILELIKKEKKSDFDSNKSVI